MMDLFSSNIATTYPTKDTNKTEVNNFVNINKPFEIRDRLGNLDGYFWYQGNSVDLVFNLDGYVIIGSDKYNEIIDVVNALSFEARVFDHRNNVVLKYTNSPFDSNRLTVIADNDINKCQVILPINGSNSSNLSKGRYRIELVATLGYEYHETVFPANTCIFEVK